ncbi:heterokaryon incompatibility protein-domain-containing protein [Xylariaceae sp. AK1471]|nr:heterokaryon incompatibility protein-domain-containing protein [Xylariaceae sp. AK1471]
MEFRDERLCDACVQLELAKIFNPHRFDDLPTLRLETEESRSSEWKKYIQYVGHWTKPAQNPSDIKSSCPFCGFIGDIVARGPAHLGDSRELFAFPSYLLYDAAETVATQTSNVTTSTYLLIVNENFLLGFNYSGMDWLLAICNEPYCAVSIRSCTIPDPCGSTLSANCRLVQGSSIDYDLIRHWLDTCAAQHDKLCLPQDRLPIPNLKLLDCQTRQIINAGRGRMYDYIALSYVWGKDPADAYDYPLLPERLPPVIRDAMAVVLGIGLRYLWVDRYCIWQDDPIHKMNQVNLMDQIYGNAYLTINACAGEDPEYGLPGVGVIQRRAVNQTSTVIGQETLVTHISHREQSELISASTWRSRAWTLQEEALSPRRLYVTDSQMSFECRKMMCVEHIALPFAIRDRMENHNRPGPSWNDLNIPKGIWTIVTHYSERRLTYQRDRLAAISAVFNEWSRLHPGCFQYWGVPVMTTPSCWRTINDPFLHALLFRGSVLTRAFLASLHMWSVTGNQTRARNRDFPSWSWAGLGTNVQFPEIYGKETIDLPVMTSNFDAKVWVERPNGTVLEWEQFCQQDGHHLPLAEWTQYLHIEAWVFKIGPFFQRELKGEYMKTVFCTLASSIHGEGLKERVRVFKPDSMEFATTALQGSKFEAISFAPLPNANFVLVLDKVQGVLERIGFLDLEVWEIVDKDTEETMESKTTDVSEGFPHAQRRRIRLG